MKFLLCRWKKHDVFEEKLQNIFKKAKKRKADIILLPEDKKKKKESYSYKKLKNLVKEYGISILITKRGRYYSARLVTPCRDIILNKISNFGLDKKKYLPGKEIKIINYQNVKFSILICYDLFFPEYISKLKPKKLDFLIVQSSVPEGREKFWRALVKIRSVELQKQIISIANTKSNKEITSFVAEPTFNIKNEMNKNKDFLVVRINKQKTITKSPSVRGRILFKKKLYGPFRDDLIKNIKLKSTKF